MRPSSASAVRGSSFQSWPSWKKAGFGFARNTRCVGKIVSPACAVGTTTAMSHALSSDPSSSWNARARDAVGADVILREPPERRLLLAAQDAFVLPRAEVAARLLLGVRQCQVDDVVRAPREVDLPLGVGDDVIRRRDQLLERARLRLVVAQR